MKRRDFIALVGAAAAWPVVGRAQQPVVPIIGFLGSTSPGPWVRFVQAFREGLKEFEFIDGQNVIRTPRTMTFWACG